MFIQKQIKMGDFSSYYKYEKFEVIGDELIPLGIYSIDADGTMPYVVKEECDTACGCIEPQYRWIQTEDTICIEVLTQTVSGSPYCVGYDRYEDVYSQVSYDNGVTWETTATTSTMIEENSSACGYVPPTPTIDGKFKLTLSDSTTVTAECDATSAITSGEVSSHSSGRVVIVSAEIGECVSTIGDAAFANLSLTSVTIPSSVTCIDNWAFGYCTGLTSVTIPDSVTSIGDYTFYRCTGLTSVSIPNSLTSIDSQVFFQCSSLTSITIPDSVTSIDDWAFGYCTRLRSVTVNATTPPTLGSNVFYSTNDCPIYVPSGSVNDYKAVWSSYSSRIQAIPNS